MRGAPEQGKHDTAYPDYVSLYNRPRLDSRSARSANHSDKSPVERCGSVRLISSTNTQGLTSMYLNLALIVSRV